MRTLIASIAVFFSCNAFSMMDVSPDQMTPAQQVQLIQLLNQLQPEMLETLLTDEALDWYIGKFTRGEAEMKEDTSLPVHTGQVDGIGGFDDPNLPKFL
jgi:hypothetical protein